ncbi:MAG: hypothetical protein RR382_05850 [Tannerellaceae bacterium]
MKKSIITNLFLSMAAAVLLAGCSNDNVVEPGVDPNPDDTEHPILFEKGAQLGNGDQEFDIKGKHTLKKGTYLMKGWCYVTAGAELTIEPGTIIKGDKETKAALIVEPGGKVLAQGTAEAPIIFTSAEAAGSRKPGDWGGLVICGKAKNNKTEMQIEGGPRTKHGGNDDNDNSGVFSYIRVEFGGYPFKADQEINGITFGSVGKATKVDHLQVSYSNDDSYEWFGGTMNAKYLVAYHGWDDEFDTDNGFSGHLQYLLSIRNPKLADTSLSNGFESDNNADGSTAAPYTTAVFSNVTLVGPIGQAADFMNTTDYINGGNMNPNNGAKLGTFQSAMHIRRNSRLSCFNTVAIGYPVGLLLDNEKGTTQTWATNGDLKLQNLYFAGMTLLGADVNKKWKDAYSTDGKTMDEGKQSFSHTFFAAQTGNKSFATLADLLLNQPNSLQSGANYGPKAGSPLLGHNNLFVDALLSDSFFDQVTFIGAFKSDADADNWTKGWTNFDPQTTVY